jgi:hypothetical protein
MPKDFMVGVEVVWGIGLERIVRNRARMRELRE